MFNLVVESIDTLAKETYKWNLSKSVNKVDRIVTINGKGLHILQYYSPQIGTLFTDLFTLIIHIPDDFPLEKPVFKAKSPIFHPHIDHTGFICWDENFKTWRMVCRDIYLLLKQVIIPMLIGNPGVLARDIFEGKHHMNIQACEFYRNNRYKLPWHKGHVWK